MAVQRQCYDEATRTAPITASAAARLSPLVKESSSACVIVQQRRIAILAANCDGDEGNPEGEVDVLYDILML